jgi:hypothetical protein
VNCLKLTRLQWRRKLGYVLFLILDSFLHSKIGNQEIISAHVVVLSKKKKVDSLN